MDRSKRHRAMMSRGVGRRVVLRDGDKEAGGEVRVAHFSHHERFWRAARALGMLWGLAALSIVVPAAHFVLVPAFLIAGPIVAILVRRQASAVLAGEGACPACSAPMLMEGGRNEWPLHQLCQGCGVHVTIELVKERGAPS